MSLKLQQCAFIQLEETSVAGQRQQQGGGDYGGGREGGSQCTASLTLRLELSLLQLPTENKSGRQKRHGTC